MPVRCRRRPAASSASWKRLSISLLALILSASTTAAAPPPPPSPPPRYSARIIPTKSGQIRGILQDLSSPHLEPVEVFRGVPYAAPPQGELRFRPPLPANEWKEDPKLADKFGRVCPQNFPDLSNESIALQDMPQSRYNQLLKFANYLTNQSEDCLFLNLYIPGSGARGLEAPYAVIVYIHGESFEWGTGNIYDGSVLASAGHVIVITMNYRLGILGFLRTKPIITESAESFVSGNLAIHDIAMGLTWVRENIAAFGGDPTRVTLIGHDTGAALVNYLLLAPFGKGLFHKVVLLSGSALSPWASLHDPNDLRVRVAKQLDCTYQNDEDIAECLRTKSLEDLIQVELNEIKFMPKVGPSVPVDKSFPDPGLDMERLSDAFIKVPMILGVCTAESVLDFNADDIQYGFEEEQRNRVLRTFIRNAYVYHLNEILSAVRNEYTDWDKPVLHPVNIREATMEALSDGQTVAPLMRIAFYHARRGANTYFFHFSYQTKDSDYSLRLGSVRGDDIPYLFGLPLISGGQFFPKNYTRSDQSLAEVVLTFFTNFAKTGNPNEPHNIESVDYGNVKEKKRFSGLIWEKYETSTQQYLQIALKPKMKNHYRGHKMAVWLNLIPQLHQPGDEVSMSHHHFRESGEVFYAGAVRDEWYTPLIPNLLSTSTSTTTVCSTDEDMPGDTQSVHEPADETKDNSELLQRIASRHYYSTTTALAITVGVGCFLLVLNMLIFAGIYYQRDRSKKRDVSGVPPGGTMLHHVSNGQHSQSRQQSPSLSIAGTSRLYQPRAAQQEMPSNYTTLPKMVSSIQNDHLVGSSVMTMDRKKDINPPQPPQRTTSSLSTGATLKKRVQIQEITV